MVKCPHLIPEPTAFKEQHLTSVAMVHHVHELRMARELRSQLDNLVSLCDACHNRILRITLFLAQSLNCLGTLEQ
ncbi:HNH endonuclease [Paenibacillus sp. S-38]|uniref:HNH endonuclease n=1 Tax=Paenibacillus sp. S-38 TaxID=3416710 RepID=UPI003CF19305